MLHQKAKINLLLVFFVVSLIATVKSQKEVLSEGGLNSNNRCNNEENKGEIYNGTVCSLSQENIIDIETRRRSRASEIARINTAEEMESHENCQQSCFRDQLCRNFTYFHHTNEASGIHTYKCILFRNCAQQLKCETCVTGPPALARPKNCEKTLMTEILAEVVDVNNGILTGEELGKLIRKELGKKSKKMQRQPKQLEDEFDFDDIDDGTGTTKTEDDDYFDPFNVDDGLLQDENVVEDFPDEEDDDIQPETSSNGGSNTEDEDDPDYEYPEPESGEYPDDEDDEDDGDPDDDAETVGGTNGQRPRQRPTFFHCIMGGYGPFGPIRNIGHIGFGAFAPTIGGFQPRVPRAFPIASIPTSFPLGLQGTYTTMLGGSMYLCSPGAATTTTTRVRSFFDQPSFFEQQPRTTFQSGRCSVYNTGLNIWQPFGSPMNTYRAGGSMTRMGKFIISTGGRRFPSSRFPTTSRVVSPARTSFVSSPERRSFEVSTERRSFVSSPERRSFDFGPQRSFVSQPEFQRRSFVPASPFFLSRFKRQTSNFNDDPGLNTIEVLSTRKPGKWRALTKFRLPNSTYDHCTVPVNRTSIFVIGGFGQESQAVMIDLKYKTYRHKNPLKQPRRQHACTKVRINGRNGIVVAGGSSDANLSLSSLEFFDLNTERWYSLGRMRQGRRFPAITLMNGKMLVTGGETTDVLGQTVILDTMEALRGRRWAKLKQKLPEERSRFSLQRIPQKFLLT